ncbi:hypothetical protein Q5P01_003378 [Channa striata]|uniref:RING-type domain-containing protein n=1 Tax=Channa striata TaxID=64152 RepID=A0AA88NKU2_CHASR|nr:hypothetical protein Q5P01_003378 [Channa striata]
MATEQLRRLLKWSSGQPELDMTGTGSGGQSQPDEMDTEEAERCPICLGVLAGGELAMPDSCCHIFCLRCLLTWAKMAPSCPVDRRPFTNVYKWDGDLSCVQVSVSKQVTEPEAESCCCSKPERNVCLKSKPSRRMKRQKVKRTADAKTKGFVRKCNEEDPSFLNRKKVKGTECSTWSPSPCVSLTSTQDVVWVTDEIEYDTGFKECKSQVQDCPWLSPAAHILADGTLRQHFDPTIWNRSRFSFGHCSSPFTSSTVIDPGTFVFHGVVCAIPCAKGGDKRGGRASTSKAPTKEGDSLPSRRSGRTSKAQEETPLSASSSPPQSSSSDCDSSANQSTKTGRTSQVPAKRRAKQVTSRKASGKRKAKTRKKHTPEVVNSPAASEEEEEGDQGDETEGEEEENKTEQERDTNDSDQQQSDAEGCTSADPDNFNSADEQGSTKSLHAIVEQDSDDTQEQFNEHEQEDKPDEGNDLVPDSSSSCSGDDEKREEQEPASPISSEDKGFDKGNSLSPSDTPNALLDDLISPHCDEHEQDDNMEICAESEEGNGDEFSKEMKADLCENLTQPCPPSAGESEEDGAGMETKSSEGIDVKILGFEEPSVVDSVGEGIKEDSTFRDDTEVVPMDCSSPMSEHGNNTTFELPKDSGGPSAAEPPENQVSKDQSSRGQQEREKSQERKNGRQRRSRFHSPTSTWSPKRDSKRDSSRRSRSRSRERDSSPHPGRSWARSRERIRDRDSERDNSRRDRSHERRRRRSKSRSRSRSHSRSRSRSRTRSYRRGPSPERPPSRDRSPQRKQHKGGWRSGHGSSSGGEGRRHHGSAGRFENGVPTENSPDRQGWSDNPDWVTEKTRNEAEGRNRDFGFSSGSRWEDRGSRGESRSRGARGGFERGRGAGRGGGNRSFYSQQEETSDNRWQPRNNFSGTGNNSGNDSYSRFNENRGGGRRKESEQGDSMLDRSGWSSASSWAVRKTLPADVQDYYSKKERGGPGGWSRPEEEQQAGSSSRSTQN